MAKNFYEAIIASGGFAGESFDITAGPANLGVLDVLLSIGDGILTIDAPVNLVSTGSLNAPRTLDLSGVEQNGRFFFLSIRNDDIGANPLTLLPTTSINGFGPTTGLIINSNKDYILTYESGGVWRAYEQQLSIGAGVSGANIFRTTFASADWGAGTSNEITIIRTGAPGAGEIGPHNLINASSYAIQVYRNSDDRLVQPGIEVDSSTGNIILRKTGLGAAFAGRVIVVGS